MRLAKDAPRTWPKLCGRGTELAGLIRPSRRIGRQRSALVRTASGPIRPASAELRHRPRASLAAASPRHRLGIAKLKMPCALFPGDIICSWNLKPKSCNPATVLTSVNGIQRPLLARARVKVVRKNRHQLSKAARKTPTGIEPEEDEAEVGSAGKRSVSGRHPKS